PSPANVTVSAVSAADSTQSASSAVTVTAAAPISISISPANPTVQVSGTQQFTATVSNTSNTAVIWSVNGVPTGNSLLGTLSASGNTAVYTAPAAAIAVTLYAWSVADPNKSGTTVITVVAPPVSVSVSPASASVPVSATQQFTANVTNTTNTAVTWAVNGVSGGNSTVGTISSAGLYKAPSAAPTPATVTIAATSSADSTKKGTAVAAVGGSSSGSPV